MSSSMMYVKKMDKEGVQSKTSNEIFRSKHIMPTIIIYAKTMFKGRYTTLVMTKNKSNGIVTKY